MQRGVDNGLIRWIVVLIYGGAIPLPRSNTTSNRYREPD